MVGRMVSHTQFRNSFLRLRGGTASGEVSPGAGALFPMSQSELESTSVFSDIGLIQADMFGRPGQSPLHI